MTLVLTLAELAARLQVSRQWLARRHGHLRAAHGFPPPLPGLGLRWDPRAVDAWIARQTQAPDTSEREASSPALDWSSVLDGRAARLSTRRAENPFRP